MFKLKENNNIFKHYIIKLIKKCLVKNLMTLNYLLKIFHIYISLHQNNKEKYNESNPQFYKNYINKNINKVNHDQIIILLISLFLVSFFFIK